MTNRQRAWELFCKILKVGATQVSFPFQNDCADLIEQALSEPQPYFDGEYYHLAWWHREIAEKFIGVEVRFYDDLKQWKREDYEGIVRKIDDNGFESPIFGFSFQFVAIPKETYERVMGEENGI